MSYLRALKIKEPQRKLILAVPEKAYKAFFTKPDVQAALHDFGLNLLVYNANKQIITTWLFV